MSTGVAQQDAVALLVMVALTVALHEVVAGRGFVAEDATGRASGPGLKLPTESSTHHFSTQRGRRAFGASKLVNRFSAQLSN